MMKEGQQKATVAFGYTKWWGVGIEKNIKHLGYRV